MKTRYPAGYLVSRPIIRLLPDIYPTNPTSFIDQSWLNAPFHIMLPRLYVKLGARSEGFSFFFKKQKQETDGGKQSTKRLNSYKTFLDENLILTNLDFYVINWT